MRRHLTAEECLDAIEKIAILLDAAQRSGCLVLATYDPEERQLNECDGYKETLIETLESLRSLFRKELGG